MDDDEAAAGAEEAHGLATTKPAKPAAGHVHHARSSSTYDAVAVATSPDRTNPVVHALLERVNGTGLSLPLRLPLVLASSDSFQDDLAHLLCARHLVVASSSLNAMLLDSPNLKDVYEFSAGSDSCGQPQPCVNRSGSTHGGGHGGGGGRDSAGGGGAGAAEAAEARRRQCRR